MTTIRKSIIIGLAVLGLGTTTLAVQAQSAPADGRQASAMSKEQMHAKWGERRAARDKKLHDLLKLTPSQDASWTTWLGAARPQHERVRTARADWASMPAPARMEKRLEMAKQHIAQMETQLAALNTFYATLTPEQKKVFDEHAMRHGKRNGHMGGHRMGHGRRG